MFLRKPKSYKSDTMRENITDPELTISLNGNGRTHPVSRHDKQIVLEDYRWCRLSREASLIGRRDVLTGHAKFGIFGDGKELPQVVLARRMKNGDFRAGYYRDQTLMFALGLSTLEDFFAQLYADCRNDPFTRGRQMNSHYATPLIDEQGDWLDHREQVNIVADTSNTAGQMARGLGLALASKQYRSSKLLQDTPFSTEGNEVTFLTIGDASTSEGVFWETINAAAVQQVPLFTNVWDDGYGISVPVELQTAKGSISAALAGFADDEAGTGILLERVDGGSYDDLCEAYDRLIPEVRANHRPALFHVYNLTQPQGHSTSGSHQRYKSKERLQWEAENDCILRFRNWIIQEGIATETELDNLDKQVRKEVRAARDRAQASKKEPMQQYLATFNELLAVLSQNSATEKIARATAEERDRLVSPFLSDYVALTRRLILQLRAADQPAPDALERLLQSAFERARYNYEEGLYSDTSRAAIKVPVVPAQYNDQSPKKNGYEIINSYFRTIFEQHPQVYAFGEDVGQIGDVNQGFAGLQEKFGKDRVFDAGIREWTIMGQAIGMAMRGLRPIAEIQYLDYLLYGLEPLSDDLATLRWRSGNIQMAPAIIRTRGHRLEGVWHAGSPMQMILGTLRGMYVCVPRNFVQAAGMYNTLLQSDDPGLVIEPLNAYRLKERLPENFGEFTVPLGSPEILQSGTDITLVTYGSCVRIAEAGIELLREHHISVELIDVQTLLPFDLEGRIVESLRRTGRVLFLDEDLPSGGTAYMMQQVLEVQNGYRYLDAKPQSLSAKAHRTPYGSDGDYFTKPQAEDVAERILAMIAE